MKIEEIKPVIHTQREDFEKEVHSEEEMLVKKIAQENESVIKQENVNWSKVKAKCFPLSKGYTRLSIVIMLLVAFLRSYLCRGDEILLFISTLGFMIGIYVSAVWIYWGFKNEK